MHTARAVCMNQKYYELLLCANQKYYVTRIMAYCRRHLNQSASCELCVIIIRHVPLRSRPVHVLYLVLPIKVIAAISRKVLQ